MRDLCSWGWCKLSSKHRATYTERRCRGCDLPVCKACEPYHVCPSDPEDNYCGGY